jgi:hypothetical protein
MRPEAAADSTATGFTLGMFDLYFVSKLSEEFSFLGEVVFETSESGEPVIDVERVIIKYARSDLFKVALGRTHTALGYWNEAYHHGALLQPTVERPEVLKFEDDGGILPVHSVGIEVSGSFYSEDWWLSYVGNVANGRGTIPDMIQVTSDLNRDKALGIKVSLERREPFRFHVGGMVYHDRIPADPATPGRESEIGERIDGAHLYTSGGRFEAMAELYRVGHEDMAAGAVRDHVGWYALLVAKLGRVKPYGGFERLDFEPGDAFYAPADVDLDRVTGGVRIDPNPFVAVKLEYRNDRRPDERTDGFLLQTAFTF